MLYKGAKNELNWDENKAAWVAAIIAGGCTVLSFPILALLKRMHAEREQAVTACAADAYQQDVNIMEMAKDLERDEQPQKGTAGFLGAIKRHLVYSLTGVDSLADC